MQIAQLSTPLPSLQCLDQVEQLVTDSLRDDWIVRIEHTNEITPHSACWHSWGKALFAIKDPTPVIDAIMACRANHPSHAIRLHAEKVRPEVRFVYWVHRPHDETTSAMHPQSTITLPASPAANTTQSLAAKTRAARSTIWRYLVLVGTLFAAALLLEETAIAGTESAAVKHTVAHSYVLEKAADYPLEISKRALSTAEAQL